MNTGFGAGREPGERQKSRVNWYDYGARFYDASLGRFHTIDPMADFIPGITPYNYCYNTPTVLTDRTGMLPEFDKENNDLAATFIDPTGKIIKVTDDDDNNIYLVNDPDNWDGKSKDGLLVVGSTPTPTTLAGYEGQNITSNAVVERMFGQAANLEVLDKTWLNWSGISNLRKIAALKTLLDLLKQMQKLNVELTKLHELQLNEATRRKETKAHASARIVVRSLLGLYGNTVVELNDEITGGVFPENGYDDINEAAKNREEEIINKYDKIMNDLLGK